MSFHTVTNKIIECDGCGYVMKSGYPMIELKLQYEKEGIKVMIPLHFHPVGDHDCLRYFMNGTGIMERVLKEHESLPDAVREGILASLKHR